MLISSLRAKFRSDPVVWLMAAGFVIINIALGLTWYRHQMNPDATSYFGIASEYAHFHFRAAINGYWGPLLSWLLVPAVWLHLNLIAVSNLISILVSLIGLAVLHMFLIRRKVSRANCRWLLLAAAAPLTYTLVSVTSPDVLMAVLVGLLAVNLINFWQRPTSRQAAGLGAIGALMYFAKGFGFYLFVFAILGLALASGYKTRLKHLGKFGLAVFIFGLLTAPFILAISIKYHRPTINTAGGFDHALYGPASRGNLAPTHQPGLLTPPTPLAESAWQDPTYLTSHIPDSNWKPASSSSNRRYFIHNVVGSDLASEGKAYFDFGLAAVAGLVAMLLAFRPKKGRGEFGILLYLSLLISGGYSLVFAIPRYLLGVVFLSVMSLGLATTRLKLPKATVILAVLAMASVAMSGRLIVGGRNPNVTNYNLSASLANVVPAGSKIVSDSADSYYVCYWRSSQCWGILKPPRPSQQASYYKDLKQHGIGYFVEFSPRGKTAAYQQFINKYFRLVSQTEASQGKQIKTYQLL
jgi:hypothetical protein